MDQKVMSMAVIEGRRWKMSKEYIEREAALKAMSQAIQDRTWSMDDFDVMMKMEDYVAELPAADVKPVQHGEWNVVYVDRGHIDMEKMYKCSVCGGRKYNDYLYCPECGAIVDGGNK